MTSTPAGCCASRWPSWDSFVAGTPLWLGRLRRRTGAHCAGSDGAREEPRPVRQLTPRDRAGYLIYLADVLARPGKQRDLEAIQLVENLDSARTADLIRTLSHRLTPHAKVPAAGDFVERA